MRANLPRGMSPATPRFLDTPTVLYGNFLRSTDSRCSSAAPSKIDFDLELDDYEEVSVLDVVALNVVVAFPPPCCSTLFYGHCMY